MPPVGSRKDAIWELHPLVAGEFGPVPDVYRFRNGAPEASADVPSLVYLLARENNFILVDTSFRDPAQVRTELGIRCERKTDLSDLLLQRGVEPGRIGLVIFTHLHWDHAACNGLFPKAQFLCQREELQWLFSPPLWEIGYEEWFVEDVFAIRDRLCTVSGDRKIADGVEVWHVGGHTAGSQAVAVTTTQGTVVITGDTVMTYQNVESQVPIGLFHDLSSCVRFIERLRRENLSFIPSHDWTIRERCSGIP